MAKVLAKVFGELYFLLEYRDERTGRRTARARFDWQAKTVTMQYQGEPRVVPLPPDAGAA